MRERECACVCVRVKWLRLARIQPVAYPHPDVGAQVICMGLDHLSGGSYSRPSKVLQPARQKHHLFGVRYLWATSSHDLIRIPHLWLLGILLVRSSAAGYASHVL